MIEARLTTIDNPYSPFDEFPQWYSFDTRHGYKTTELLARLTNRSFELSDADQEARNIAAIDEIVSEDINGLYVKVTREVPE